MTECWPWKPDRSRKYHSLDSVVNSPKQICYSSREGDAKQPFDCLETTARRAERNPSSFSHSKHSSTKQIATAYLSEHTIKRHQLRTHAPRENFAGLSARRRAKDRLNLAARADNRAANCPATSKTCYFLKLNCVCLAEQYHMLELNDWLGKSSHDLSIFRA
jgi:hypothetical protein